ncbi:MAG: hypothetical protein ACRDHF_00350 [Tepidiformaceae bacterium]
MGAYRKVAEQPSRLSDAEIQAFLDSLAPKNPGPDEPIWDAFARIMADASPEELAEIPPSDQVDHFLYGTPLPEAP